MLDALRQRTVATVLFDEHHGEAWSVRPEAAARNASRAGRRRRRNKRQATSRMGYAERATDAV